MGARCTTGESQGKYVGADVGFYMTEHLLSLSLLDALTDRATLAASVKASLTPRFFIAEHSSGG